MPAPTPPPSKEALIARAKPLELSTPYEPPPGDPLEHNTSGYAKTMCSAVFITGLDPDVAAEASVTSRVPTSERKKVSKPVVDRAQEGSSHLAAERRRRGGPPLLARKGCITLPRGRDDVFFKPVVVARNLPDARTQLRGQWATCCQRSLCRPASMRPNCTRAIDAAFDPVESLTLGLRRHASGTPDRRALHAGHHARRRRSKAGRWARASPRR